MYTNNLYCPRCNGIISTYQTKRISQGKKARNLCQNCRDIHIQTMVERNKSAEIKEKNRVRMKETNPMFSPATRAKVASTISGVAQKVQDYIIPKKDLPKESEADASTRMKHNNPMRIAAVKNKRLTTFKQNLEDGKIIYKRGSEHHLWKGNRDFNNSCRTFIYNKWTIKVLERDNFQCTNCSDKNHLQVHHIKPLRIFIQEIKDKYQIDSFLNIDPKNWQLYIDEILSLHKLEDGITLCSKCHADIDPFYRTIHEN